MKRHKSLPLLIILCLGLCAASGWVGYKFLNQAGGGNPLSSLSEFLASLRTPNSGGGDAPNRFFGADPASSGDSAGAGFATDRKWMQKVPPYGSSGVPITFESSDPYSSGSGDMGGGMPLFFEDCKDYGGEFDFLNAGSGLDFFMTPGLTCIDLQRPHVEVAENAKVTYEIKNTDGSRSYDACEFEEEMKLCINMANVTPSADSAGRLQGQSGRQTPEADPLELLASWHRHFARDTPESDVHLDRTDTKQQSDNSAGQSGGGRNTYMSGSDSQNWFYDLPGFARAQYRDIVPGVDMACYADQSRMEYLFTFWPGTQPDQVVFSYNDALNVEELSSGNVAVDYHGARLLHHRPMAYRWKDGEPRPLQSVYEVNGNSVKLRIDEPIEFDEQKDRLGDGPVPPRPNLDYLTHFGGKGNDVTYGLCHDASGFAHMVGFTTSPAFSSESRAQHPLTENTDVFLVRFASSDHHNFSATFIGGSHDDRAFSVIADAQGNSYLCGETLSPDFPSIGAPNALVSGRGWDAFIAKVNATNGVLDFAYRIGGSGDDRAYGIALAPDGSIVLSGMTYSDDFPTGPGAPGPGSAVNGDAFVIKIAADGSEILGGSRLGGSGTDHAFAMALDGLGYAYLVGETTSDDFPTTRALQAQRASGGWDAFALKISPDMKDIVYSTFIGGRNDDHAYAVFVDLAGYAYIAGETSSDDFPVVSPLQPKYAGGNWDGFLMKLEPSGEHAVFSTYIGGTSNDRIFSVCSDVDGHLFFGGATASTNLPVLRPVQASHGGGTWDGFIGRLSPKGTAIDYISYIGAEGEDSVNAMSLHTIESMVFAGRTSSTNLQVQNPMQSAHRGRDDTLIGRIMSKAPPSPDMRLVKAREQPGGPGYDFYIGTFEVTNEDYVRFLNDAQANPATERGTNLYVDARGDMWFNTNMVKNAHEILSIQDSRIVYRPEYPLGSRYAVTPILPREGESYATHPVVGVSWYGAVKYCNWLTIATGRSASERCFREGNNPEDWAPVTSSVTNWSNGRFTVGEREAWLKYRGFRIPMDNCAQPPENDNTAFLVTRPEFIQFLNDAQADPRSLKGIHLVFDAEGNVRFNDYSDSAKTHLFKIHNSGIVYTPGAPAGTRYALEADPPSLQNEGDPLGAPVRNVSWYGAVKYCNWLSLTEGLPATELSYREGTNFVDWAAKSVAPNDWVESDFSEENKKNWLQLKGKKLPYQSARVDTNQINNLLYSVASTNSYPNYYNEFYKAAAWSGNTNGVFGFGRGEPTPADANYLNSGLSPINDTTKVGFFNGSDHGGKHQTATNENRYGIYDLSGNVTEWLVDPGTAGPLNTRACYGGSWMFPLPAVDQRFYVHPHFTDNFRGFRVVSTQNTEDMYAIRLPFRICICGYGVGAGCGRDGDGDGDNGDDDDEIKQRKGKALTIEDDDANYIDGIIYGRGEEGQDEEGEEGRGGGGGEEGEEDIESVSGDGDISGEDEKD